ncbi:MAG: hypothetical protein D6B26_05495 [Spirochaetaceae bacterium]|nr:MAG: hypothetical protein D6B26_05495 [Spirochaetaceae bacterium]
MRFKYVQGVPSAREGEGYPLYKLRMLDVLIDRLHKMKADSTTSTATPRSEEAIDVMIENYERQIDAAAASLGQVGYGTSWGLGLGDTGTLVSAVA